MQLSDDPGDRKDFLVNLEINPLLASFLQGKKAQCTRSSYRPTAGGSQRGTTQAGIRVWNWTTRQPAGETMVGLDKEVRAPGLQSGRGALAAGDSTGSMRFWNTSTHSRVASPSSPR